MLILIILYSQELKTNVHGVRKDLRLLVDLQQVSTIKSRAETLKPDSGEGIPFSGPILLPSGGFAWAKNAKEGNVCSQPNSRSSPKGHESGSLDASNVLQARNTFDSNGLADGESLQESCVGYKGHEAKEVVKQAILKPWKFVGHPDSFNASEVFRSQGLLEEFYFRDEVSSRRSYLVITTCLQIFYVLPNVVLILIYSLFG